MSAIIAAGRALRMLVVAEGLGTQTQVLTLTRLGCDIFQGFYFSGPLDAASARRYLVDCAGVELLLEQTGSGS